MIFDNTGTGGSGVSAIVSQVEGASVSSVTSSVGTYDDVFSNTLTTTVTNFLQPNDIITVSATDNSFSRTLTSKIINGNYHFKYFNLTSAKLLDAWQATTSYQEGDLVHVANRVYVAESTGVNTSGSSAPTHTSGSASDGNMLWKYLRLSLIHI